VRPKTSSILFEDLEVVMRSPSNGIRVLGIVCLLLAVSVFTFSQTTAGRILGSVSDQSGAAVAGAAVVVTDVQRGTTRVVATDAPGNYAAPDLQPGSIRFARKQRASKPSSA
jgi:hypothetical protein